MLDDTTVPGYQAGDGRLIDFNLQALQGDEQGMITGAADMVFHSHWDAALEGIQITDRSDSLGLPYSNAIKGTYTPWVVRNDGSACTPGGASRFCSDHTCAEDCGRWFPPGFDEQDTAWKEKPTVVVSAGMVLVKTNGGKILALENGSPF